MEVDYAALKRGYPIMASDLLNDEEITWLLSSERCVCGHQGVFHSEEFCWVPDCECPRYRTPPQVLKWEAKAIVADTRRQEEAAEWDQVWVEPTEADKERGPTYRYVRTKEQPTT